MAIEIVDFPINNSDFPVRYVSHYWRVNPIKSHKTPWNPIKPPFSYEFSHAGYTSVPFDLSGLILPPSSTDAFCNKVGPGYAEVTVYLRGPRRWPGVR